MEKEIRSVAQYLEIIRRLDNFIYLSRSAIIIILLFNIFSECG